MCEIEEHDAALAVPGDSVVGRRCAFARLFVMQRQTVTVMRRWRQNHAVTLLLSLLTTLIDTAAAVAAFLIIPSSPDIVDEDVMLSGCPSATSVPSSRQVLLPRYLVNGLSSLDDSRNLRGIFTSRAVVECSNHQPLLMTRLHYGGLEVKSQCHGRPWRWQSHPRGQSGPSSSCFISL